MKNKTLIRATALLLMLCQLFCLCACKEEDQFGYEVIDTLKKSGFVMAFREGDKLCEYVPAALQVLAAQGVVKTLAVQWFGEDETTIEENADALSAFGEIPQRDLILGFSDNSAPMSYEENGQYKGFDIDLAGKVCELLGWKLKLQPMDTTNLSSELQSGNVDVVWGGLYLGASASGVRVTDVYMNVNFVLVARTADNLGSLRSLRGKFLSMSSDAAYSETLEENEKLRSRLGSISRLASGATGCFTELENGACDVIMVDSAAAQYYIKG